MAKQEKTMESSFEELEHIIEQLEDNSIGLEDSFKLYNQGMKVLKACNDSIDKVEKKIIMLDTSGEKNEL